MGCLFDCFRSTKDDESTSDSVSQVKSKVVGVHESKNRLSALFLSEENGASSTCHDIEGSGLDSMHIDKDVKDEAQILKACSTIPVTPVEMKKAFEKMETHVSNSDAMDEIKNDPCEEMGRSLDTSSEQTPSSISCLTDARNNARISSASSDASEESIGTAFRDDVDIAGMVPLKAGNIKRKTKSVRSSKNSTSRKPEMAAKTNTPSTSPNLTALKLSHEIQTPRTIFPEDMGSAGRGRQRVRSQFVYPASNIIENASLCKLSQDLNENLEQAKVQGCKEKREDESPTSTICEEKLEDGSDGKYAITETSSSPWMNQGKKKSDKNMEAISITPGDRPIIGMVAAHWNENKQSQISPKWWDGNGIPNSTNKYKEDQKVSWHATPFEERLEKALSEEGGQSFIPSRKLGIVEETERDTAISHLRHSAQSMSVVSF
ncbi:protein JASON isoform X2 [Capsella rubella]|uniref:protein JASON isoform X2 n=1 Tax=Capsella rubella TaxID=81985 RepID=UPI000CD5632F|nr:protein JASON isoform X2 [Capsella rubella]